MSEQIMNEETNAARLEFPEDTPTASHNTPDEELSDSDLEDCYWAALKEALDTGQHFLRLFLERVELLRGPFQVFVDEVDLEKLFQVLKQPGHITPVNGPLPLVARGFIQDIVDMLEDARRMGAAEDNPEGVRYIQMSDELACLLAERGRRLLGRPVKEKVKPIPPSGAKWPAVPVGSFTMPAEYLRRGRYSMTPEEYEAERNLKPEEDSDETE